MADIENHEYQLLDAIAQDSLVTQAGLSTRLGIAVGSVNWYIKRLIHRGWVKVSHLDRTRLKYDLTAEGMSVLTKRSMQYMKSSLKVYNELRGKAKSVVEELKRQGIAQVYLEGNDEGIDILRLTCIESGIAISDRLGCVLLKADGAGYQVIYTEAHEK